ncbi:MAG: AAA family ATPase [Bacteroidota bacterium]
MEAIIFIGIQATGKSSFYKQHFFNSHVRLSLDLLNTRNKLNKFLQTCLDTQARFVLDNTNLTVEERAQFIQKAKDRKYKIIGYYFNSAIEAAYKRNAQRKGKERIPEIGIKGSHSKLQLPTYQEGFDELFYVQIKDNQFEVSAWENEV